MMADRFPGVYRTRWLLLALLLIAFALRVYHLDAQSLWSDEGLALYRSRLTLVENLSNIIVVPPGVPTRDTNPPLYFILLSGARALLGESEYALRFLSVAAGVLLVPLLYVTGKRLFSVRVGLIAAVLGTLSPFLVWYSQEARVYTQLAALSLASVYWLLRALDLPARSETARDHRIRRHWPAWFAWGAITLAMLSSHFNAFFVLPFEGLVLLIAVIRSRRREALIVAGVLLVLALPLIVYAVSRAQSILDPVFRFRPLESIAQESWSAFLVGAPHEIFQPWWAVLPGLALFVVGAVGGLIRKSWRTAALLATAYLFVPLLAFYATMFVLSIYVGPRHIIFVLPPFYLLLALGVSLVWDRARVAGMAALAVVLSLMVWWLGVQFADPSYSKDDIRSAACAIAAEAQPDDVVIINDAIGSFMFDYYYARCHGVAPWKIIPVYPSTDFDQALRQFQAEAQAANRVWYLTHPQRAGFDAKGLDEWARGHLLRLSHRTFPSLWLGSAYQLYTAHFPIFDTLPPSVQERMEYWPSDELHLVGREAPDRVVPGESLPVALYWRIDQPGQRNLATTLRLVDQSGAEWALDSGTIFDNWSVRQWPVGKIIRQDVALDLPADLPPGDYQLLLIVQERKSGQPLAAMTGTPEVEAAHVYVGP